MGDTSHPTTSDMCHGPCTTSNANHNELALLTTGLMSTLDTLTGQPEWHPTKQQWRAKRAARKSRTAFGQGKSAADCSFDGPIYMDAVSHPGRSEPLPAPVYMHALVECDSFDAESSSPSSALSTESGCVQAIVTVLHLHASL